MPAQSATYEAIGFQILGPVSVALLLFQIYRGFRSSYVFHWASSFFALTLFHAASAARSNRASFSSA